LKKIPFLLVSFLVLALGVIAVGCGGGSKKTVDLGNGNKVSVGGGVPSDFPSDFPKYSGANVQGSYTGTEGDVKGTVVTWTTGDSVDKVTEFFNSAFKDGPWKSTANGTISGNSYWAADSADGTKRAYVMVSESSGETSIIAAVGPKDSGSSSSGDSTSTSGSSSSDTPSSDSSSSDSSGEPTQASEPLPDEVKLSDSFPKDRVPFPDGARVTADSSFSSGGMTTNSIELYVKDSPENVANYFKNEMPKHGWENAFSSTANGEWVLTFSTGDNEGLTISVSESSTSGYAQVSLTVVVSG
jgi:hypothetical protein